MYLKVHEFDAIEKALMLLPEGKEFSALSEEDQQAIVDADIAMVRCLRRHKKQNAKTWDYIKERRKDNPDYCRPSKS